MNLKRLIRTLFPQSRHAVSWRSALPLILFLILFAATCLGLEREHVLLFERPAAFWLTILTGWLWSIHLAGRAGLSHFRSNAALFARLLFAGALIMVLAEPRAVRTRDVVSVVYALDVSDSIGDASVETALEFVAKQVSEKPENDEAGLIVFGGTAAVELPPRKVFPFEGVVASQVQRDATNIEQSLSLAAAMLPAENRGRIVLISDGTATGGSLNRQLDELKSRGIAVDVLPIKYQYDREVWIERLELPQYVKLGEDYEASVVVSALQDGTGTLTLRENGQLIQEAPVEYKAGKNRFSVPIRVGAAGYYEYQATIDVPRGQDNLRQNNTVLNFLFVEGEGRILVVTDPAGSDEEWKPLVDALDATERAIEVRSAFEFPHDPLSLLPYDCVIWVNTPADAFDEAQLEALHDSVRDLGTGFLMVGGPNSFGPGGYRRTPIEKALPVSMDVSQKKVLPKGALAIILHTCEFPEGNTWGKRITIQAIKVLSEQDEVGVLVFDGGLEEWLFKLTPVSEFEWMVPKINAAQIGDMPSFAPTMAQALDELKASDAAAKHVIIISDGDPTPPAPGVLKDFRDNKITISTVAIFPHGGVEVGLLRQIAEATGGRYYFPDDPNRLPSIFIKEAKTLKRVMIQEKEVVPEQGILSPILKGVDAMAPLQGYVLTSLKNGAEPVLQTPPGNEPDEDENDPILAKWRYGLGATAAFTSDFSTRWGRDWLKWTQYRPLIKQLVTNISRVRSPSQLRLWTYASGGDGMLMVEDFSPNESFLELAAIVSGPDDRSETITLRQVTPRRYQTRLPLWGQGRYQVIVRGAGDGRDETVTGGFIVPYSPEYLRFRSNPIVLDEIRTRTDGERLELTTSADTVFGRRAPKESSNPIFDWFLIGLAILVPVDVAIRRIQLDPRAILAALRRKPEAGPATPTMSTLLQRKQEVTSRMETAKPERRSPSRLPAARATSAAATAKPPVSDKPSTPASPTAEGSTTSKLLELKRKRQEEEQN
ncbi:VWA domain-containing protein [bacterium]|nr:VWA domain-containing protein [bacterium]